MPYLKSNSVQIPTVVNDIIVIEIKDNALTNKDIEYRIIDSGQHICRKGHFKGLHIQMRISHLKDGKYSFNLNSCDTDACSFSFEKISGIRGRKN